MIMIMVGRINLVADIKQIEKAFIQVKHTGEQIKILVRNAGDCFLLLPEHIDKPKQINPRKFIINCLQSKGSVLVIQK